MVPDPPPPAIVLGSSDWHEGVVGIVASRLVERLYRPTILLSESDDVAKGSGRSIPGFDLLAAVAACSAPLTRFGGHQAACGLRLPPAEVAAAFARRSSPTRRVELGETELARRLTVDAVVCGDELTLALGRRARAARATRRRQPQRHAAAARRRGAVAAPHAHARAPAVQGALRRRRVPRPSTSTSRVSTSSPTGGATTCRSRLRKNAYNGGVRAQVEVQALLPLDAAGDRRVRDGVLWRLRACRPGRDLVAAARRARRRRSGRPRGGDWAAASAQRGGAGSDAAAAAGPGRRRRPGPAAREHAGARSVAGGGRVLLLVADVGRRRPLLTRDLPLGVPRRRGPVPARRLPARPARRAVPARRQATPPARRQPTPHGRGDAAAGGRLRSGRLRRPAVRRRDARCRAPLPPAPAAWLHFVWGQGEVHFAEQVMTRVYDLDGALRRLWRRWPAPRLL